MRSHVLHNVFELLYGPLAFLHEPIGRLMFGPAWHARRLALFDAQASPIIYLDLGCGEGRLLAARPAQLAVGLDASWKMAQRAQRRGATVVAGHASALPFRSEAFQLVICTYPGPWILEPQAWSEIARVLAGGGRCMVLLGGTYMRGPWSRSRQIWSSLAYGRRSTGRTTAVEQRLGSNDVIGSIQTHTDDWGEFYTWEGTKC